MHIVQLVNFHAPNSGGIKVALGQLAAGYTAAGHRCTQIRPGETESRFFEGDVEVITLRAPVVPGLGGYRMILGRRRALEHLSELAPDAIELSDKTTLAPVGSAARRLGVPVVMFSHERLDHVVGSVIGCSRPVSAAVHRYNRWLTSNVDAVVCASEFAAAEFADSEHPSMYRVPLGVDLDMFRPLSSVTPNQDGVLSLVAVVRLSPEKDPGVLLDAVRELISRGHSVRLNIFGTGNLHERLAAEAASGRLPIRFHGHVADRSRLAAALAAADVVLAPGPRETFGLAALEALASGVPVVVPNRGALVEMISAGVGAVASSTGSGFADAVERILGEDGFPTAHRVRARQIAERFTWGETVAAMLRIHHQVSTRSIESK